MIVYSRRKQGLRFLNTFRNKLPFELHIPGYQFCGPGAYLQKRLGRGDREVNKLDAACQDHDVAYASSSDLKKRHEADTLLGYNA